jgi:hypothetical protein
MTPVRRISPAHRAAAGRPRPTPEHRGNPSAYPISVEVRRELLEQLQVVEIHLQTAAALELRADRSPNATFAAVLRDRAGQHRRTAAKMRADLFLRGLVSCRPRRP